MTELSDPSIKIAKELFSTLTKEDFMDDIEMVKKNKDLYSGITIGNLINEQKVLENK